MSPWQANRRKGRTMGKYVMVAFSAAKPGRDDDYNKWYDNFHLADICALPGVKSGRRFESTPLGVGSPMQPYLSIFEIETDNPEVFMAEMGKRAGDGTMRMTDALDVESVALRVFKAHEAKK
jgi:hypothetical protein